MTLPERRTQALVTIAEMLEHVDADLVTIDQALTRYRPSTSLLQARTALEAGNVPMWTHQPTRVSMESRGNGDPKYMYLYWSLGHHGYDSPTGGRKTYIGSDADTQKLAVAMVANGKDQIHLTQERDYLNHRLSCFNHQLEATASDSAQLLHRSQESSAPTSRGIA